MGIDGYRWLDLGYVICMYNMMDMIGLAWCGPTFIDGIGVL